MSNLASADPHCELDDSNVVTSEYFNPENIPGNTEIKRRTRKRKTVNKDHKEKFKSTTSNHVFQKNEPLIVTGDLVPKTCYTYDFYNVPCVDLARNLLGKVLVRRLSDGTILRGRIVETECYLGVEDKASHSYQGKKTDRNMPMFSKPGTSYVYLTYGMYDCFNISSDGEGAAVLIRALHPLEGEELMQAQRVARRKHPPKKPAPFKSHELCNGPGKLTMSFAIDRSTCNKVDMTEGGVLFVEAGDDVPVERIVVSTRIGIESAGEEWAKKPLRFYELGNPSVSRRDRKAEEAMLKPTSLKTA